MGVGRTLAGQSRRGRPAPRQQTPPTTESRPLRPVLSSAPSQQGPKTENSVLLKGTSPGWESRGTRYNLMLGGAPARGAGQSVLYGAQNSPAPRNWEQGNSWGWEVRESSLCRTGRRPEGDGLYISAYGEISKSLPWPAPETLYFILFFLQKFDKCAELISVMTCAIEVMMCRPCGCFTTVGYNLLLYTTRNCSILTAEKSNYLSNTCMSSTNL